MPPFGTFSVFPAAAPAPAAGAEAATEYRQTVSLKTLQRISIFVYVDSLYYYFRRIFKLF